MTAAIPQDIMRKAVALAKKIGNCQPVYYADSEMFAKADADNGRLIAAVIQTERNRATEAERDRCLAAIADIQRWSPPVYDDIGMQEDSYGEWITLSDAEFAISNPTGE